MENFIKSGKKGTVLMSLGTNVKSNMLGEQRLKSILEVFAQLTDYNFLWKFESEIDALPLKPTKNVMIEKFLPQNDILAHPNLVAFITHSGLLSTHEALWHGKPIVGIPIFVDQHRNLERMIQRGLGIKVDFRTLATESFKENILTVLTEPKYTKNAKQISKLFQDKPQKPLDVAVWWIEYAMRNPDDLENMKSPTLHLGAFVSGSYDILLAVVIFVHLVVIFTVKFIKAVKKLAIPSKKKKE